jgi:mRNA-degrading endonuclease RelE of RelBE toxin-antitoxin system
LTSCSRSANMAPLGLLIDKRAARRMMDLLPSGRRNLLARLARIAADPFVTHANVTRLKGEQDLFRLRQGDWRAVYRVDRAAQEVRVLVVEKRSGVYR